MITKQDYSIAALVGFLVGVFAIPTLVNVGIKNQLILIVLPAAAAVLFAIGMMVGKVLSQRFLFMVQFTKFVAVGFLNTAIDFGILNMLSLISGSTAGLIIAGVNIPGFLVAVFNAYFWNKFWVFQATATKSVFQDLPKFLAVTVGGLIINSTIVYVLTTFSTPLVHDPKLWLNIAKVAATAVALFWNFFGYKFVVFRR